MTDRKTTPVFAVMIKIVLVLAVCLVVVGALAPVSGTAAAADATATPNPSEPAVILCKNRVNIPQSEMHWLFVPADVSVLRTELDYLYLAGRLIDSKVVDASSCPAKGLASDGFANACGLAAARSAVIEFQNLFDPAIMKAWEDVGVPPVMLKQLIRVESQFWPGPWENTHFGLGHMTFFGAHTALTWRPSLRAGNCPGPGSCTGAVTNSEVYRLLDRMDATCEGCEKGIDMAKANASVDILANVLMGHCLQTTQVVRNATERNPGTVMDYVTIWKLTLMNYNVGPTCVLNAVAKAWEENPSQLNWPSITQYVSDKRCERGVVYSNQITERFYNPPQ